MHGEEGALRLADAVVVERRQDGEALDVDDRADGRRDARLVIILGPDVDSVRSAARAFRQSA